MFPSAPSEPAAAPGGEPPGRSIRPTEGQVLHSRLQWQTLGRLIVTSVLLGITLLLVGDASDHQAFTPTALLVLIGCTFALSAGLSVGLTGRSSPRRLQGTAWTYVVWDLVLATGLVYLSGGAGSALSILFGAAVLNTAVTLNPRQTLSVATAAALLYLSLALSLASGWIPIPPDQAPAAYALENAALSFALLSNLLGLFLVGVLGATLAGRLGQADARTQRLGRLNDDIVRSLSSGLITADENGHILAINPAGATLLGEPRGELVGTLLTQRLPINLAAKGRRGEGLAQRANGERFPIGYTQTPLVGANGEPSGSLLLFQDLSEIKSLRDKADTAERLAVMGRLASALAHEIRNPLGSISGAVQMVRDVAELGEEDQRLLTIVLEEVERLNELVSAMLDLSRPPALRRETVELRDLAEGVVAMAAADTTLNTIPVVIDGATSATVDADSGKLRQVLWNLLKNAIQASPADGKVELSLEAQDDVCILDVRDHGSGIDPEQAPRLFEMFYSKRDQGIGLGLAVVKQIVDSHGGRIEAQNHPDGGALFRLRLPRPSSIDPREATKTS